MNDLPGRMTANQRILADYEERFRRSSQGAADFLDFLKRSQAGTWRFEQDSTPGRWWINITLPAHQAEVFGLHREIQVLYTEYEHVEPRALSVIQGRVRRDMRVEPDVAILVSRDKNVRHTTARRRGEMAIVPIDLDEIRLDGARPLHALIGESVATVDHFDVATPVRDPSGFYGRSAEIDVIAADLRRAISVGVFGLRKTGKTSLLNSLTSLRDDDERNVTVRVDVSEIVTGEQFRSSILEGLWDAVHALPGNGDFKPRTRTLTRQGKRRVELPDSSASWIQDIRVLLQRVERPAVLVVDEVDQAFPPRSNLEPGESRALFSSLVQLRSLLQEQERLALLCAGVDPALFERPIVEGKDNLLYKLVKLIWLAPMSREEMAEMVRSLGRRMGVRVRDHEVIDLLFDQYGGHPLLTRKACSFATRSRTPQELPFHISREGIEQAIASREYDGPQDQAADVVTSFTEWFSNEAALLRLYFSSRDDENELARSLLADEPDALLHAVAYGLCFTDRSARVKAAIDALER
ncbi:ATP-binding protein [Microbacterium sp. SYP-A9085]|uniref:ATP-binding protein n=1 Tax=Microbacterium sp. SYP-A9085 TaxID=2664454 RepID=UPI001562B443